MSSFKMKTRGRPKKDRSKEVKRIRKLIDIPVLVLQKIATKAKYKNMNPKNYIEMIIKRESDSPTTYRYTPKKKK